mgnify:FL=1
MTTVETTRIGGRRLKLTNLDKRLWPRDGLTKGDLIRYVVSVGPTLLQFLSGRPLTVRRFPDGIDSEGFYQKNCPSYAPDWIPTYAIASEDGAETRYIIAEELATLVWLANQGAIEFHPWMSRIEAVDRPDYAVIDLDPGAGASFDDARYAAVLTKRWLDRLGLRGFAKTSGATGIHIYIPLAAQYDFATTSQFIGLLGKLVAQDDPARITTERLVRNRPPGTVYFDHLQNLPGKTIVAPLSPRPVDGGIISAPFAWDHLDSVQPKWFTLINFAEAATVAAQLAYALTHFRQTIEGALNKVRALVYSAPYV